MGNKLKVGLLLDSLQLWAWQRKLLQRLAESNHVELSLVALELGGPASTLEHIEPQPKHSNAVASAVSWVLRHLYGALEAKIHCERDAFSLVDPPSLPADVAFIEITRTNVDGDKLRQYSLDVLVYLGSREIATELASVARFGVWFLGHGDNGSGSQSPPGFWEVYDGAPVSAVVLYARGSDGARDSVIDCSLSATNRLSVKLNRSSAYWKALSMLPRKLAQLHRNGAGPFFNGLGAMSAPMPRHGQFSGQPTNLEMAIHIGRNIRRRAAELFARKFTLQQWILMYRFGEALTTSVGQFQKIIPPRDRYWADPHVVKRGDLYYVFVEEYMFSSAKGHIAVLELDERGGCLRSRKVMEHDYHLSYPFIFEHAGELFMIPESSAKRTVELYRCTEFPAKWVFVEVLIDDIFAVDSTLLHRDGRWWLFTNVVENAGASPSEELFLFYSDSLYGGKWTSHPMNPVVSDARRARPAGAIFEIDGELYRPAQDCSLRYGYAIKINRITTLGEEHYGERQIESIKPDWDKKIIATHTISYTKGLTVIDCLQARVSFC